MCHEATTCGTAFDMHYIVFIPMGMVRCSNTFSTQTLTWQPKTSAMCRL
jgi:hypothetical protein